MMTLTDIASMIENGLNAAYQNEQIKFKIWADSGQWQSAVRTENELTYYINGNLRTQSSSKDSNILSMGVNGLILEFAVPIARPHTDMDQRRQELIAVQNGQYAFVDEVTGVLNGYFAKAKVFSLVADGITYGISFDAGTVITGNIEMAARMGNIVTESVYITCYYLESGINSRDVLVEMDGEQLPFQSLSLGRTGTVASDVFSDAEETRNALTTSAFSIDFAFPANDDEATRSALRFLLAAKKNEAHFVHVKFAALFEAYYLMTFGKADTNLSGINFAGLTGSLVEVQDDPVLLNVPDGFQVGRFSFSASSAATLTFTVGSCLGFIAGKAQALGGQESIALTPADFTYDPQTDDYYIYLVTDRAASVTGASASWAVVKEAS